MPAPFAPVPPVSLEPLSPLAGDLAREPSVYFDGSVFTDVVRLSIPLHPIVYVSPGVNEAQAERESSDPLFFSNPAAVRQGGVQSRSIGFGLGFDPALFVQHAVRESQARGELYSDIVEGRLSRLSLGSDGKIRTPEWFEPSGEQIVPDVPGQEQSQSDSKTSSDAHKTGDELPRPASDLAPGQPAAPLKPSASAAPSFSEQLRSAGNRLPPAARPVNPGTPAS